MQMSEEVVTAIADVAGVFGSDAAESVGSGFTCGEAESIAVLLAISGHVDAAAIWMDGHASGDDEGDRHWAIGRAGRAAAEVYAAVLGGCASGVDALTRQLDGLDSDDERSAREMYPRITSVLDGLATGLFTRQQVHARLGGALTLWDAEDVLDPPAEG